MLAIMLRPFLRVLTKEVSTHGRKKQWHETLHDQFGQYFAVDNVLYHEKTDHRDLIIFENAAFGRVMALDGVVQTTERDEFIYHEMMTHVPLLAHGHAKHVLIIGGGDGAMLREVTRHKNVESITMVEIDAGVVSFCRQYLPNHNAGSYDDPRFKLVIDDGVNFVNQTSQTFDVIISDCTDPIGPGESLFTSAFYEGCKRCLNRRYLRRTKWRLLFTAGRGYRQPSQTQPLLQRRWLLSGGDPDLLRRYHDLCMGDR